MVLFSLKASQFFMFLIDFLENVTHYREVLKFPTSNDLSGAAEALTRLQEMYNLNVSHIANGELNGVKYRFEMGFSPHFVEV